MTAARWNSLRATAAVSQQAADEKDADAKARAADVEAAQSNLDRLKAEKGFANIVAPFDGVVTARNVDVGTLVRADGVDTPALFTVADIHQMRIYVPVPETYAADLKDGMKATLELPEYPDRTFDATIITTSHAIDPEIAHPCWWSFSPTTRMDFSSWRIYARPFSDPAGPQYLHRSGQRDALSRYRAEDRHGRA